MLLFFILFVKNAFYHLILLFLWFICLLLVLFLIGYKLVIVVVAKMAVSCDFQNREEGDDGS